MRFFFWSPRECFRSWLVIGLLVFASGCDRPARLLAVITDLDLHLAPLAFVAGVLSVLLEAG